MLDVRPWEGEYFPSLGNKLLAPPVSSLGLGKIRPALRFHGRRSGH